MIENKTMIDRLQNQIEFTKGRQLADTTEEVFCRICGIGYRVICQQHLKGHGISRDQYEQLFPQAPLFCRGTSEMTSIASSKNLSNITTFISHTKETVKERLSRQIELTNSRRLVDRTDGVFCRICGDRFHNIKQMHLSTHQITREMYQELFPEALLFCDDYSAIRSKATTKPREVKSLDITEATQLINNSPSLSWSWFAGFFQAEGSVDLINDHGVLRPRISLTIKDSTTVEKIASFINEQLHYESAHAYHLYGADQLRINDKNTRIVLDSISHYLYGKKRCEVFECLQSKDDGNVQPLSWDFITGFWEGDGSVSRGFKTYNIQFAQKDPSILYALKTFFVKGCLHQHNSPTNFGYDNGFVLTVTDSPLRCNLTQQLLECSRTLQRRIRLVKFIYTENISE